MSGRPVRALAMASVFCAFGLVGGGCGGPEEGTHVEVDKEKEAKLTNAMEKFYTQKEGPGKQKEGPDDKAK